MVYRNEHYTRYSCIVVLLLVTLVGIGGAASIRKADADTATVTVEVVLYQCSDGADNDFDGQIDFPNDPGCESASDDDETDPQCLDGIDNDGDGLVDYPADPGCSAATDDDETDPVVVIPPSGGGGTVYRGAPIIIFPQADRVTFSGFAHPNGVVVLLRDGHIASTTRAASDATFSFVLSRVPAGVYVFSLYGTDSGGIRSGILSFSLEVPPAAQFDISGIFIPPTISFLGETAIAGRTVSGYTVPGSDVHVVTFDGGGIKDHEGIVIADGAGHYAYTFPDTVSLFTDTIVKSFAATALLASPFGRAAGFLPSSRGVSLRGDVNNDGRVNLIDFSIAAFWYKRAAPPEGIDLNNDGLVDLVDVSIMMFNWTG